MFESSIIHCFWDTPQHFLITHLCLALQKSLLVSLQGCWTQWQRFENSSIHQFLYTYSIFSKHILCFLSFLKKSLLVSFKELLSLSPLFSQNTFLHIELQLQIPTSKFTGVLNTIAKFWKLPHTLFLRYST